MLQVGALLAGKYRVERVLGQGGMGVVAAALHIHLNQRVALKFLLPEMLQNRDVVERFLREARASAQLRGEHVCRVSDVGTLDSGAPYIVMELLEGSDLASMLAAHGPMPVASAVDYVLQACLGVAEAHSLGVVHRDLKPANLFLARRPDGSASIKVLDFGIAKAQSDTSFNLTRTASVLGSPGYMSPEQLRSSRDCDARSDIWSIGVILYELVSGRPPFNGESITELALHIAMDPTPPMMTAVLPPGFEQVVQHCLAKDPAQRYPELASLATALVPYGGPGARELAAGVARLLRVTPDLPGGAPAVAPTILGPTTLGSAAGALSGARRAAPRWWIFGGVGVVAAAGIAIAVAVSRDPGPRAAAAPSAVLDAGVAQYASPARAAAPSSGAAVDAPPREAAPASAAQTSAVNTL